MTPPDGNGPLSGAQAAQAAQEDLGGYLYRRTREAVEKALIDSEDLLKEIAKAGGKAVGAGTVGNVGSLVSIITDAITASLVLDPVVDAGIGIAKAAEGAAGPQGTGFGLGYLLGSLAFQALQPWLLPLYHFMSAESQFQILDPGTAAQLAARRLVGSDFAKSEAEGGGFNNNRFDLLVQAAESWPALGEILELRRRGEINPGDAHQALQRQGIPEEWIPRLLNLERILLSPADLALALLRGNVDKSFAQDYAAQLGVEASDLDVLVGNTGEPPGLEEMLLAYRLGYIDDATLDHGIRQSRVKNEWIPLVKQLRFRPPPTADAIKASVENYITQEKAKGIAAQNGLNPDEFDWVWKSWGEPISKTEALELWRRNLIDQATVEQSLREGRLKDKYIPAVLDLKRHLIPIRQLAQIITHGIQPASWGIDRLIEQGYTHEDAAALVGVETAGKAAVHKELAQTMILNMYEARGITRDEAITDLGQLGWDEHQAEFILKLQDAKVALAEQHKATTAIRNARLHSRITEHQARAQLASLGVGAAQADVLLRDWNLEIEGRVTEPTAAEIAKATRFGGITWEQGLSALETLGYTRDGAAIVLIANEAIPPKGFTITHPAGL